MINFTRHLSGWSVLFHVLLLAVIGLTALSAVSCRTQKSVEQVTIRADTLSSVSTESETVETVTQAVQGDSVSLMVPMGVIQNLPEGAEFSKKQGRTRLSLRRHGEAVVAEAVTDSMVREVTRYERYARDSLGHRGENAQYTAKVREKPPNAGWICAVIGAMFLLCVTVSAIAIKSLFK